MNDNHLLVRKGASPAASSCGCARQQLGEAAAAPDSSLGRSLGWQFLCVLAESSRRSPGDYEVQSTFRL
jgi:hypothetical protein